MLSPLWRALRRSRRRLRTVADIDTTFREHSLTPRPPNETGTLATHSGKTQASAGVVPQLDMDLVPHSSPWGIRQRWQLLFPMWHSKDATRNPKHHFCCEKGTKWHKMAQNDTKWHKMAQNGKSKTITRCQKNTMRTPRGHADPLHRGFLRQPHLQRRFWIIVFGHSRALLPSRALF